MKRHMNPAKKLVESQQGEWGVPLDRRHSAALAEVGSDSGGRAQLRQGRAGIRLEINRDETDFVSVRLTGRGWG
jgi:hypothetical protein